MVALVHAILVVLGLPKAVPAMIVRLNAILDAMVANKTVFPSPPVALATAQTHLAALVSAEAALRSRTAGGRQVRDDALKLVKEDAQQLHAYVQQLCNASPAEAAVIAANAAMTLHKAGAHAKADVTVTHKLSGTLHVSARSVKGAKAHDWQLSTDGGKTWSSLQSTTKANTVVTGLQPATAVQIRHRVLTKAGPTDWSSVATAVVS
jgi:hypothetical protein